MGLIENILVKFDKLTDTRCTDTCPLSRYSSEVIVCHIYEARNGTDNLGRKSYYVDRVIRRKKSTPLFSGHTVSVSVIVRPTEDAGIDTPPEAQACDSILRLTRHVTDNTKIGGLICCPHHQKYSEFVVESYPTQKEIPNNP